MKIKFALLLMASFGICSFARAQQPAATDYADSINTGLIPKDTLKASTHRSALLVMEGNHLQIDYGSPGVRGRVIWGGLVAYNEVWVTGAHSATALSFNNAIQINGKRIEPGKYALFTIPGEKEWTIILNKNFNQHLTDDYKEGEDIFRMKVTPLEHALTERLTYTITDEKNKSGEIVISWEKLSIPIPFKNL
jgi:Protein of unknown function (DUF2911)